MTAPDNSEAAHNPTAHYVIKRPARDVLRPLWTALDRAAHLGELTTWERLLLNETLKEIRESILP